MADRSLHSPRDYEDLAQSNDATPDELRCLATSVHSFVIEAVAANPRTPSDVLLQLRPGSTSSLHERTLLRALAANSATPEALRHQVAEQLAALPLPSPEPVTSGFLVVKRFEILYGEFASRDSNTTRIYALPTFETLASEAAIRYRGLDRDAVRPSDWESSPAAEIRMSEINPDIDSGYSADYDRREFLATHVNAVEVLKWADEETPGVYEILWTRIAGRPDPPPPGFHAIGYEPTYFGSDHFSALCDCMCFPRWHGTDPGGTLFLPFFRQLNVNGLFDDAATAVEFLAFYLSFDWTETGNYETAEVWVPI